MSDLQGNETTNNMAVDHAREALAKINSVLSGTSTRQDVYVAVENSDDVIRLSREVATVLQKVLTNVVAGRSVSVVPTSAELTTQQAANLLNVSRPHVVKLIDQDILPAHKVGTHRRIYAADVEAYKHQRDLDARAAADELAALTEGIDLYE
ncbi:helix-turn-helix domain-containing protein [Corynebacterium testudinoris]|uniref:DNA-binding protein, excisionase family n=1 Tax=Corynebacterium testudinoris TaxID=136857 RepID=A0A0G3H3J3_9CORY|nr:helix-turn-helix domain-containing protein [Corynebacterium testudinoris]AKK07974.1 DNA-binding protein, excisionase family [Corynebacterium testudinoris]MBX8995596.1 helix-turn-helix domain-containing protein [Corynebacterium testudinoris]